MYKEKVIYSINQDYTRFFWRTEIFEIYFKECIIFKKSVLLEGNYP